MLWEREPPLLLSRKQRRMCPSAAAATDESRCCCGRCKEEPAPRASNKSKEEWRACFCFFRQYHVRGGCREQKTELLINKNPSRIGKKTNTRHRCVYAFFSCRQKYHDTTTWTCRLAPCGYGEPHTPRANKWSGDRPSSVACIDKYRWM